MAKYSNHKKPSPSFSNFSDLSSMFNYSFKPYKISCSAYSTTRVTMSEAEEVAHKMLRWYPNVWIVTPAGMSISVKDGEVKDFNEGVDNTFNFEKFELVSKKKKKK